MAALIHVHRAEGGLHEVVIVPANVTHVESPNHQPGGSVAPYNSVIHLVGGRQVTAMEPRAVVGSLLGKALFDTAGNAGYYYAVQSDPKGDKALWDIKRADYEE